MISSQQIGQETVAKAATLLHKAGIVITPEERARVEVADFGLGELAERRGPGDYHVVAPVVLRQGTHYVSRSDLSRALASDVERGSGERKKTFRCRWGNGVSSMSLALRPPRWHRARPQDRKPTTRCGMKLFSEA